VKHLLIHAPSAAISKLNDYADFRRSRNQFRSLGGQIDATQMMLGDRHSTAASVDPHYFTQDIHVARTILAAAPDRHVDVGSRIDGFVSHLAVFREVEIVDIRPEPPKLDRNIRFHQGDLMNPSGELRELTSSLSCLHTLEHLGLGRYGDEIDPNGYRTGLNTLAAMLKPQGTLYVSVPVGKPRVVFNAHRIFAPEELVATAPKRLHLSTFDLIDDTGNLTCNARFSQAQDLHYGCGIYTFVKQS
jgi:hypothetical protein